MLSTEESNGTLLASAARIANAYSPEMHNNARFKGVLLVFDVTAEVDTASVAAAVEFLNPATGEWESYLAGPTIDATGEKTWIIYPLSGLATDLGLDNESSAPLPLIWRLYMNASDTDALTYSVGYQYLP